MPVSWSLDKVGPMCRDAEDCAVVFEAIRGPDGQDLAVVDRPFNWDADRPLSSLRVGYLEEAFDASVERDDAERRASRRNDLATLDTLRRMGLDPRPIRLPERAGMDALQMLLVDESAAFDELMHNGRIELLIQDRAEPEPMLMRVARLVPAVEYVQLNRLRMLMMQAMAEALGDVDVYLAPHGGSANNSATNLTGHPAVNVPNGFDEEGRPTGVLFVGKLYGEAEMLSLAKAYQDETGFHLRHPRL
jgi:Asp-tRNA(Asn)/Glu-tRNA(Gln) amidotransferase A subunit family amidase